MSLLKELFEQQSNRIHMTVIDVKEIVPPVAREFILAKRSKSDIARNLSLDTYRNYKNNGQNSRLFPQGERGRSKIGITEQT